MSRVRSLLASVAIAAAVMSTAMFAPLAQASSSQTLGAQDSLPPIIGPLPFVQQIYIHSHGDLTGPVCAGDSIFVDMLGSFPNDCYELKRIDLIDPHYPHPISWPPFIRLIVDDHGCEARPCSTEPKLWRAHVALPPLPNGVFNLRVEVAHVTCADSLPPDSLPAYAAFLFGVVQCTPPQPCMIADWVHAGNDGGCDARISKTEPAQVTFTVAPQVALAGLQGHFSLSSPALDITNIEAIGRARDMSLNWTPEPGGARFVLFAPRGAPIPSAFGDSSADSLRRRGWPVLRLTVQISGIRVPAPPVTSVQAYDLLGSDIDGGAVGECPILTLPFPLVAVQARICAQAGCDFNHDGRSDIRDLVRMAHCIASPFDSLGQHIPLPCADSLGVPDCNGDGAKTLADVICCALNILRNHACPDCPNDTTPPPKDPSIRVVMGTAIVEGDAVRIPVTVENTDRLGGALVALRYPSSRYTATFELPPADDWLQLQDIGEDVATVGLVRIDANPVRHEFMTRSFELRLRLKAGQQHGGAVEVADVQLSSASGASIEGGAIPSATPLAGRSLVELSEARPNPFADETRFSVKLSQRGETSVGVFDLAGRRVALLHRGMLEAGPHEFSWRGTHDDGTPAPSGVFFYRATVAGHTASRRMVRLGN